MCSALTYHLAAPARCGPESSCPADFHIGAKEYAGEDHQVRNEAPEEVTGINSILMVYSFMAHPETLLPMPNIDDPLERFVSVVKFYLSGWHIKPP